MARAYHPALRALEVVSLQVLLQAFSICCIKVAAVLEAVVMFFRRPPMFVSLVLVYESMVAGLAPDVCLGSLEMFLKSVLVLEREETGQTDKAVARGEIILEVALQSYLLLAD